MLRSMLSDDRLEAIAGPPVAQLFVPGSATLPGRDPFGDVTAYAVCSIEADRAAWATLFTVGVQGERLNLQAGPSGDSFDRIENNYSALGGTQNTGVIGKRPALGDRQVIAFGVYDDLTMPWIEVGGQAYTERQFSNSGEGMNLVRATLPGATGDSETLTGIVYFAHHDEPTRTRIMAWLARRYGITPPPPVSLGFSGSAAVVLVVLAALTGRWHAEGRGRRRTMRDAGAFILRAGDTYDPAFTEPPASVAVCGDACSGGRIPPCHPPQRHLPGDALRGSKRGRCRMVRPVQLVGGRISPADWFASGVRGSRDIGTRRSAVGRRVYSGSRYWALAGRHDNQRPHRYERCACGVVGGGTHARNPLRSSRSPRRGVRHRLTGALS